MSKKNDRTVYQRTDGKWVNKPNGGGESTFHDTQEAAILKAKRMLRSSGGGELTIMGRDGKIRDKVTIWPGNDPFPPRG